MEGISGLFAPLVTPYTDDGSTVSEVRMCRQMQLLQQRGIAGYVTTTDSGEFLTLSFSERKQTLEIVLRESRGLPVLAHVSTMSTSASLDLAQHASRHGARAVVVGPPYYGRYTDDEIVKFYETIAAYAGAAVIYIDPLKRLGEDLRERLAQIPQVFPALPIPQPIPFPTYSDSLQYESMIVTPAALLKQSGDLTELDKLIAVYGGKRIGKAGLEILGVEVGSPRAPAQDPPRDVIDQLKAILAEQVSDESAESEP